MLPNQTQIYDVAMIPGSYDPPHAGHLRMITETLTSGLAERVVVAAISNPTKTRLLDAENSVALMGMMIPDEFQERVLIENAAASTLSVARKFNPNAMIRGMRTEKYDMKELFHETMLASFFRVARCLRQCPSMDLRWLPPTLPDQSGPVLSSTRVRKILADENPSYAELKEMVPGAAAEVLITARSEMTQPVTAPEGSKEFNERVTGILNTVPQARCLKR